MRELGLFPDAKHFQSSEQNLIIRTRLANGQELGAGTPPAVDGQHGIVLQFHESLLNNSLDRLDVAGKTMSEDDLKVLLEARMSKLLDRTVTFPKPEVAGEDDEKSPNILIFAATDPIRVHVGNGIISLTIRAGFKREGEEDIPHQIVTVPLKFSFSGDQLLVQRAGGVSIAPLERPKSRLAQIRNAGIIKKKFELATPDRDTDRKFTIDYEDKKETVTITSIIPMDGWLTITLD